MPKANDAKTGSAPKKRPLLLAALVVLALFALFGPLIFYQPATAQLKAGGKTISLEIASDEASRQKGLGDRKSMSQDKGMIFVFDKAANQCFWMKDMHFSLDMIFVNSAKQIVHIERNVSPKTYPKSFCTPNTRYVVELNAGEAAKLHLHDRQTLSF